MLSINKPIQTSFQMPEGYFMQDFLRDFSDVEDEFKYEWNNGFVERTYGMSQQYAYLFFRMQRAFFQTEIFEAGGAMGSITDMITDPQKLRRPHIAVFKGEQIDLMRSGKNQISPLLAEIISDCDRMESLLVKLLEYFQAGVQVVWHIYPVSQQVHVFTSPTDVTICMGKTICSGEPAVPGFQITAGELFA